MSKRIEKFSFYDVIILLSPTGEKASNLKEFLHILEDVPDSVIFHHLYQFHIKYHYKIWDYPNDFANWAADSLEDQALAEKLANFDPYDFPKVSDTKDNIIEIIEEHMWNLPTVPWVRDGFEFYFSSSTSIVSPIGHEAVSLKDFRDIIATINSSSIYYHFYEARKRQEEKVNDDFSLWIENNFNKPKLVKNIRDIDFYFYSLSEVRSKLLKLIDEEL